MQKMIAIAFVGAMIGFSGVPGASAARAAYIGKVKDDQIGRLYAHDIRAAGVTFETKPASEGPATGCSYILVTGDGERTMNTYLGAAQDLTPADIDAAQVAASEILYLEGYLWDPKSAKEAFVKAAAIAHQAGRQVALTLSDAFCVDRYRDEFLELMRNKTVDLVFANEAYPHALLVGRLDNLGKGASGAAVQNIRLMLGLR